MDYNRRDLDDQHRLQEDKRDKFKQQVVAGEFDLLEDAENWLNVNLEGKMYTNVGLRKSNDGKYLALIIYRVYIG